MNSIKRNIPHLITLSNLTCGLLSIVYALNDNLFFAGYFIFFGAILDFFDGLSARLLKVSSEIGKQLDSMADMVTFGVAPGIIIFQIMSNIEIHDNSRDCYLVFIGFMIPLFSAIRLAKFNVDTRQTSYFIGLPTPASAIFIASLPIISQYYKIEFTDSKLFIWISIIISILLVVNLPLFSLKLRKSENWGNKENIIRIIFLISCVILLFMFDFVAIPFIVILYIFLSILNNLIK